MDKHLPEIFFVDLENGQILAFAPSKGLIMEVSATERDEVKRLLGQQGLFWEGFQRLFPEVDLGRLVNEEELSPKTESQEPFLPSSVVLFPTLNCQLRCLYCYSSAGKGVRANQELDMDWQTAKTAMDFVIRNTQAKGETDCFLGFHGGGEPTLNRKIFQSSITYFLKETGRAGLEPTIDLATNGILTEAEISWIATHMKSVQISLDGTEDIQNFQRPRANGSGSFTAVCQTIDTLRAKKVEVVIHSVVTEKGMLCIPDIVGFLAKRFTGTTIHLEPVCRCGRGLVTGQNVPSTDLFVRGFVESLGLAQELGAKLHYSGAGPRILEDHSVFCGAAIPNFVVTPSGLVTACHEVAESTHPLAEWFIYGHLDSGSGEFVFDHGKMGHLRRLANKIDPRCVNCFARPYCAGDCLARNLPGRLTSSSASTVSFSPRCLINRGLMKHFISEQFFGTSKEDSYERSES